MEQQQQTHLKILFNMMQSRHFQRLVIQNPDTPTEHYFINQTNGNGGFVRTGAPATNQDILNAIECMKSSEDDELAKMLVVGMKSEDGQKFMKAIRERTLLDKSGNVYQEDEHGYKKCD